MSGAEGVGPGRRLRDLLAGPELVVAPGAYDAITARAVQRAGWPAVYMTGAGTAATVGYPDYGLLGMSEMAEAVGRMTDAVDIPVIADADTGYGNELNVTRTVRSYGTRGAAALHIEDQVFPKRCGHLDHKQVVPADRFVAKIEAALEARTDPDLVIIARTDARAVHDLDDAVERANRALAAGADMAFVEAPQTVEEISAVPRLVQGPCLFNMVGGGRTPPVGLAQVAEAGYRLVILPTLLLGAVVGATESALEQLRATGAHPDPGMAISELFRHFGADEWDRVRDRFPDRSG